MRARLALEDATITELPVLVTPILEELLHGLLLRVDRANCFPAGSTAATVARYGASASALGRASLSVSGRVYDLEALAALLGWEHEQVAATTFDGELTRIFGVDYHARVLGARDGFRVCPLCVAEHGLIRRETVLPGIAMCSQHRVRLVTRCSCGRDLDPNSGGEEPFTCSRCWTPWAFLPAEALDPREDLRQRRAHHAYRVVLGRADETLHARIADLAALDGPPRWSDGWSGRPGSVGSEHYSGNHELRSLGACVAALLVREVPPERLFEPRPLKPRERLECTNRACPSFGRPGSMRLNGMRPNGAETYCAECGSRYIGDRMIVSYDHNNGAVPPAAVGRNRARLAAYHERLAAACDALRDRQKVHIGDVFRLAGVPNACHLRATRLGLVSLIRSRMDPTLRLDVDAGLPDPSPRWSTPPGKVRASVRIPTGPRPR